ncbi:MAG: hypothetical protein NVV73_17635 [Cellvibrionaceae bacterium]|nr:hypothetical protein [Cellvibrionaceae bacterium]
MSYVFRKKRPCGWPLIQIFALVFALSLSAAYSSFAAAQGGPASVKVSEPGQLEAADQRYQEFVDLFLREYLKKYPASAVNNIDDLVHKVSSVSTLEALAAIRTNQSLLLQNTTKKEFTTLLEYVYRHNDTATVQTLAEGLKNQRDSAALSGHYFLLAKYYESRQNWKGVQAALGKVDVRELSAADTHYYHLLMGFTLQNLKQHRKALISYQQIPPSSPYFSHVKLNEGTAFLRQGWWTEAHIEFEKAIKSLDQTGQNPELRNRILVVLGYSQLNYEFYRDARDTFRKVALNSGSMNKALMGIGLAAAYQKDFAGAANAFSLLAEKTPADLSVDEAYLLLPTAQVEAKDGAGAATSYQAAIRHYENKIRELANFQQKLRTSSFDSSLNLIRELEAKAAEIYAAQEGTLNFLLTNYQDLLAMREASSTLGLTAQYSALQADYKKLLEGITLQKIDARIEVLNSYLSQAKFGMAQLYDKP